MTEKLSTKNSPKTRKEDFFDKHPNAPIDTDGSPEVCAALVGYVAVCNEFWCADCWRRPCD